MPPRQSEENRPNFVAVPGPHDCWFGLGGNGIAGVIGRTRTSMKGLLNVRSEHIQN